MGSFIYKWGFISILILDISSYKSEHVTKPKSMPKYYCDYCDVFLTHDSPSVRKTHNGGRKHKVVSACGPG